MWSWNLDSEEAVAHYGLSHHRGKIGPYIKGILLRELSVRIIIQQVWQCNHSQQHEEFYVKKFGQNKEEINDPNHLNTEVSGLNLRRNRYVLVFYGVLSRGWNTGTAMCEFPVRETQPDVSRVSDFSVNSKAELIRENPDSWIRRRRKEEEEGGGGGKGGGTDI